MSQHGSMVVWPLEILIGQSTAMIMLRGIYIQLPLWEWDASYLLAYVQSKGPNVKGKH